MIWMSNNAPLFTRCKLLIHSLFPVSGQSNLSVNLVSPVHHLLQINRHQEETMYTQRPEIYVNTCNDQLHHGLNCVTTIHKTWVVVWDKLSSVFLVDMETVGWFCVCCLPGNVCHSCCVKFYSLTTVAQKKKINWTWAGRWCCCVLCEKFERKRQECVYGKWAYSSSW